MSKESAEAFRQRLETDGALAARACALAGEIGAIRDFAAEQGFECTTDELEDAFSDLVEESLDQVVAGGGFISITGTAMRSPSVDGGDISITGTAMTPEPVPMQVINLNKITGTGGIGGS